MKNLSAQWYQYNLSHSSLLCEWICLQSQGVISVSIVYLPYEMARIWAREEKSGHTITEPLFFLLTFCLSHFLSFLVTEPMYFSCNRISKIYYHSINTHIRKEFNVTIFQNLILGWNSWFYYSVCGIRVWKNGLKVQLLWQNNKRFWHYLRNKTCLRHTFFFQ